MNLSLRLLRPVIGGTAVLIALFLWALAAQGAAPVILVVGDSISAGYGVPANAWWTTLLQQRLAAKQYPYRVVNASISGDTTAGGRARLPALLEANHPAITVIELGGNDGLRGGDIDAMAANLDAMVVAAQKAGSRVLVIGMRVPPNYGADYARRFQTGFAQVVQKRKVEFVPFFFEGFGDDNALFQPDRVHPVAAAQERMLDNVWSVLQPMLGAPEKSKSR